MKIAKLGLLVLLTSFLLVGCSDKKETTSESSQELTTETSVQPTLSTEETTDTNFSFEGDTFKTPYGEFKFTGTKQKTTLGDEPVIFVEFDYTNTTDENQGIEYLLWDYFDAKQILADTTEDLSYFGMLDDDEDYDRFNKTQVEVHPGATVQAGYGYVLNDASYPLTINLKDDDMNVVGTKEFSLK